jgi:hypothetical protein
MKNSIAHTLNELRAAKNADREVKAQVLQQGLLAVQPFTESRLTELCALGDRMRDAEMRKERLRAQLQKLLRSRKTTARRHAVRELQKEMR